MRINELEQRLFSFHGAIRNIENETNEAGEQSFKSFLEETKAAGTSTNAWNKTSEKFLELTHFEKENNGNRENKLIHLGRVTKDIPTVSELIFKTSYKEDCWNILEEPINSEKSFRTIRPGTDIYMDPETSEILWGRAVEKKENFTIPSSVSSESAVSVNPADIPETGFMLAKTTSVFPEETMAENIPSTLSPEVFPSNGELSSQGLDSAVSQFIGRDYDQMDCYELVVGGLKNMGLKYKGKGGLGRYLINQAVKSGLSYNHYLNGEGLVTATGKDVFKKSIIGIKNFVDQAGTTMEEMKGVLKEGQILSFSTRTSGHTGVISRKDGVWTYINSGTMDNNIAGKNGNKAVGEETLENELKNWFKRAKVKGEGLKISLGSLDSSKLAMFKKDNGRLLGRA